MNAIFGTLLVLGLAIPGPAQEQPASERITTAARSAEQDLAASIAELDRLREQVASEKLPLAEELTQLEEQVTNLRREHDRITRLQDAGSLGMLALKDGIKARQDEFTYVGNLLDEYVRNFESKVHVSELQQRGETIEAVKQVPEDEGLSMDEKFSRQLEFVDLSVQRLLDAIGGMRFPGTGVDLEGLVADGQYALIGPVALFCAQAGGTAGVVVPQVGSTQPLIRPLEGKMQAGITALVNDGNGLLPLDPSRGGALKALVQKTNLIHIFEKGGPIMWPLLVASILALGTVIERLFFLLLEKLKRDAKALDAFFVAVTNGDVKEALRIGNETKFFVVKALTYALAHSISAPPAPPHLHREQSLANALVYAQAQELKRFRRGIPILDTVITLAPLLGLLGTVTGMMGSFSLIGGELSAPGAITGGIAEALIATAFGLGIAITALLPFNFLNTKLELARHEMESAATQLELLVQPQLVQAPIPEPTNSHAHPRGSHDLAAGIEARHDPDRHDREIRRKREAIRRRMEELRSELVEQELEMQGLEEHVVRAQGKE